MSVSWLGWAGLGWAGWAGGGFMLAGNYEDYFATLASPRHPLLCPAQAAAPRHELRGPAAR